MLGPPRLAAMGVVDGRAEAAIWSGTALVHEDAPVLEWTADGQPLGSGFGLEVPVGVASLGLRVTTADGNTHRGEVSVRECSGNLQLARGRVETSGELTLKARQDWDVDPIDAGVAATGEGVRLAGSLEGTLLRWMVVGTDATVLEVEEAAADLLAERIVFDDGEVESRKGTGAAMHHGLALAIDGEGCNRWAWFDAPFGDQGSVLKVGERFIPADAVPMGERWVEAVVALDDTVGGIRLENVRAAPVGALESDDYVLTCGDGDPVTQLGWLAQGRCTAADVDGARVLLEVSL